MTENQIEIERLKIRQQIAQQFNHQQTSKGVQKQTKNLVVKALKHIQKQEDLATATALRLHDLQQEEIEIN